jgi:toxin ParE1/3/4
LRDPVEISPAAHHDLADIWEYISRDNEDAATSLLQLIYRQCVALAAMPGLGKTRDSELGKGLRSYPVGRYVIYFRMCDTKLELVRVIHGARDLTEVFEPDSD